MARTPRDYKKLYKEATIDLVIENGTRTKALEMLKELQIKHENLNKEFDVAVETNTKFHRTIIEQSGIIHYLEAQVQKLNHELDDLEDEWTQE
jgi:DNA-binding GntR family transcriptional regulator